MIYHIDITSSTNDLAREPQYHHMDVIWAEHQTSGRGQRGHSWHSTEGKNITFSVVLTPSFLPIIEQFRLSEIVALALVDTLAHYGIECRIKWTNDIYAKDNKIAGVLIEHSLSGESIARTIVGIGLNINQETFYSDAPNPVSLKQILGVEVKLQEVLMKVVHGIIGGYRQLETNFDVTLQAISTLYRKHLYRREGLFPYRDAQGEFMAEYQDVELDGHLILKDEQGTLRRYAFKEVNFIL